MGLTTKQYVGTICNEVAWLRWRDRLRVAWALLTAHATDELGNRIWRDR
jgi:hypothetical protein